jgi:arylformamidase
MTEGDARARVLDITAPLTEELATWPGVVEPFERKPVLSHRHGDAMSVSTLRVGAHAGTHVDAPNHFIEDAGGIESIPLDSLVGPAHVVEIPANVLAIDYQTLEDAALPVDASRILLKTKNSGWSTRTNGFNENYVACDESAARWLLERGVALLGIDCLSIEPFDADSRDFPVHRALLEAGVVVVESLDLAGVTPGRYRLAVLPLLITASDGAPARAVLIDEPRSRQDAPSDPTD